MNMNFFKLNKILLILLLGTFLISGCKDKSTEPDETTYEEDAADIIAASLGDSSSTSGLTSQINDLITLVENHTIASQLMKSSFGIPILDTTITKNMQKGLYSYSYTLNYEFGLNDLNTYYLDFSIDGNYSTRILSSVDTSSGLLTLAGKLPSEKVYRINGNYQRNGNENSKVRNKLALKTKMSLTISEIIIDKDTEKFQSGSATGIISGETSNGKEFSYSIKIEYKSDQSVTLSVNNKLFYVDLTKGEVIE